jgi:hypothetical protein
MFFASSPTQKTCKTDYGRSVVSQRPDEQENPTTQRSEILKSHPAGRKGGHDPPSEIAEQIGFTARWISFMFI